MVVKHNVCGRGQACVVALLLKAQQRKPDPHYKGV